MTARSRIETVAYQTPTPEQTAQIIARARRLRAEAVASLLARGWTALRGLFQGAGHSRPAH